YDEATTAWLLRGSPGQLLSRLPHTESTPPLYYLLAWGRVRLFGDTQTGLRSLSALAGVATVPLAFAAARELADRRLALFAAALAGVGIPGLALLVLAAVQSGRTYYFIHTPLVIRVAQIPTFFIAGFTPPAGRLPIAIAALAASAGGALLVLRSDRTERRGAVL